MNFKKWVKSIHTSGYNGAHTVFGSDGSTVSVQSVVHIKYFFIILIRGQIGIFLQISKDLNPKLISIDLKSIREIDAFDKGMFVVLNVLKKY